jgi:hypothetical protein
MGDWALKLPENLRLCWNCREHTVEDIKKMYGKGGET